MCRASKASQVSSKTIFDLFGPGTFDDIQRKLERGEFVDGHELALTLRQNPDVALPAPIRDYMIRWLEGEVKRRRGRKPKGMAKEIRDVLAGTLYRKYLAALQRQTKKRRKVAGSGKQDNRPGKASRSGKRVQPAHVRAAERVARELFPNHTAAYVLNLVSKRG
jgi:hypothetical protein